MISKWGFMSKSYNNILYYIKVLSEWHVRFVIVTKISISRLDFYSRNKLQTSIVSLHCTDVPMSKDKLHYL